MDEKNVLKLSFSTETAKTATLSVPKPNLALDDAAIVTAMDSIIASGVVSKKNGLLAGRDSAVMEKTETSAFTMI